MIAIHDGPLAASNPMIMPVTITIGTALHGDTHILEQVRYLQRRKNDQCSISASVGSEMLVTFGTNIRSSLGLGIVFNTGKVRCCNTVHCFLDVSKVAV